MGWDGKLNVLSLRDVYPFFFFIQAYSPTEPPKPGEVVSRQNIPFNISESQFSLPTSPQELIQRYQVLSLE